MLYRLYDKKENLSNDDLKLKMQGALPVFSEEEARRFNDQRWGIFANVNDFSSPKRVKENLKEILYWFVDCDSGTHLEIESRIKNAPLPPSRIVLTQRGFHLYFGAKDAKKENYESIEMALINYFKGDKNAKDLSRIARAPGYFQWKDHNNPFMVREIINQKTKYQENYMREAFGDYITQGVGMYRELQGLIYPSDKGINYISYTKETLEKKKEDNMYSSSLSTGIYNIPYICNKYTYSYTKELFEEIYNENNKNVFKTIKFFRQGDLLELLSGQIELNYENFSLQKVGDTVKVFVDGKLSQGWIRDDNSLGQTKGSNVIDWLMWYPDGSVPQNQEEQNFRLELAKTILTRCLLRR